MVPKLLMLALELYRAPTRYSHLTDATLPLPAGFGDWLAEALVAIAPGRIGETAAALGTHPQQLEAALSFFIRQTLLAPQADHYRTLGLARTASDETVRRHYSLLVRMFHPDRRPDEAELHIALTARLNTAYRTLRDPESRRRYDAQLPAPPSPPGAEHDTRDFVHPRSTIWRSRGLKGSAARLSGSLPRAAWWAVIGAGLLGLLLALTREPGTPTLRVNPERASNPAPGPSYPIDGLVTIPPRERTAPDAASAALAGASLEAPGPDAEGVDLGPAPTPVEGTQTPASEGAAAPGPVGAPPHEPRSQRQPAPQLDPDQAAVTGPAQPHGAMPQTQTRVAAGRGQGRDDEGRPALAYRLGPR